MNKYSQTMIDYTDLYDFIERQNNKTLLNSIANPTQGTTETFKTEVVKNKENSDGK